MQRSSDRILVSHAGVLPRPAELQALADSYPAGKAAFQEMLPRAVADVVRRQADMGIDLVNDGEFSKTRGFSEYVRDRLTGLGQGAREHKRLNIMARDAQDFPSFVGSKFARFLHSPNRGAIITCISPIGYAGSQATRADIANLKTAVEGLDVTGYLPAIAPGTIEHWLADEHYADAEAFVFAIADAMAQEYKAVVDAGFLLQIDDPDLPDGWQMFPEMSVPQYRKYAALRVEALNHALRGIPQEKVRLHICWGSNHGPHKNDIPFEDIVDLMLRVKAGCYSFEFSNPRHEHEWRVWETHKLPEGKTIMPGVVGHATDIIEHPQLVADRLVLFANLVGRENVVAGTDCGLASRLSHPELTWAKLEALVEGARLASKALWRAKTKTATTKAAKKPARRSAKTRARRLAASGRQR
ncbi:MAG TPA: cobalamin-independent methionine synthase II family protein [Xanthobacteraceae bacterium]|nr:cobalamin-independent methionine synthase II family protein [Xanthobacteraceae bacterium]